MTTNASRSTTPRALYSGNFYFRDGTTVTAILVLLLYLLLAISLDAAGYVRNMTILAPVALGAFAVGFLMSMSRFDGFFALLHSMFAGLAWILFLMSRSVTRVEIAPFLSNGFPESQASAYFVLWRVFSWLIAAFNGSASADNYFFIFEMCFLVWWLTYLGTWSIFRYGYTWRAVIPAGVVLLINAYYAPEPILAFLVVFLLIGLLLLVRTNLSEQQLRWREQRVYYNQDIALDFLRNGFLYSVVVLALALIVPGLNRNAQVRSVMAPINQQWEQTTEQVNRLYQGINRQASPALSTFGSTLRLGGARNVTSNVVFRVQAPIGRYWRATVYDSYTGEMWLSTATDQMSFDAREAVPVAPWAARAPITQTITLDAPTGYVLFAAPDIQSVSVPIEATVRPIHAVDVAPEDEADLVEISIAQARRPTDAGDTYTVVSLNTNVTIAGLQAAGTDYPEAVLEQYLQLPDDFSDRVARDAIDITAGADTVYDKARAIELELRKIEYNDAIEAPPEGRDPVEYFLYDIRQGYCDYYATSMAVMLRSLGIPSRVVSGYAEGFYNDETYEYQVTERDAHTWVEVYFPGYGWIEFEPTAGESQLNRPQGLDDASNPFEDSALAAGAAGDVQNPSGEETFENEFDPNAFGEDFELGAGSSTVTDRLWWLLGTIVSLTLGIGLIFLWRMRFAGPTAFDPDLPPILYDRLQTWISRMGLRPAATYTPYENAQRLGRAVPKGRAPIDAITESYVRYSFSGQRASDPAGHDARAWQELRLTLWRAWLDRKLNRDKPRNGENHYTLVDK